MDDHYPETRLGNGPWANVGAGADAPAVFGAAGEFLSQGAPKERGFIQLPGPGYAATYLLALPVLVVAMASTGAAQVISGLIALTWLLWEPLALYARSVAALLPITSAGFVVLTLTFLPFDSAAFVVDLTATLMMFLVAFPRARSRSRNMSRATAR